MSQDRYRIAILTQNNIINIGRHQRAIRRVVWGQNARSWCHCRLCDRHIEAMTPGGAFTCLFADAGRHDEDLM